MRLGAFYDPAKDSIVIWSVESCPDGSENTSQSFFPSRHKESFVQLMDDLWGLGIRPTASRYHSEQAAIQPPAPRGYSVACDLDFDNNAVVTVNGEGVPYSGPASLDALRLPSYEYPSSVIPGRFGRSSGS